MKLAIGPEGLLIGGALVGLALVALNAGKIAASVSDAVGTAAQAVNPVNHDNVFATSVNSVGRVLVADETGPGMNADGTWSLGAWVYDVTHPPANTGGVTGGW